MKFWIRHNGDCYALGDPDGDDSWQIDVPLLLAARFTRVMRDYERAQWGVDVINTAYIRAQESERREAER
jgi:hypothetical protein